MKVFNRTYGDIMEVKRETKAYYFLKRIKTTGETSRAWRILCYDRELKTEWMQLNNVTKKYQLKLSKLQTKIDLLNKKINDLETRREKVSDETNNVDTETQIFNLGSK